MADKFRYPKRSLTRRLFFWSNHREVSGKRWQPLSAETKTAERHPSQRVARHPPFRPVSRCEAMPYAVA